MAESASRSPGVFISYRRRDTPSPSGWLYERLAEHFGKSEVFKDVDSIEPGDDFVTTISGAVSRCHTMLVVIGPDWLTIQAELDRSGSEDFVKLEIEAALEYGLFIVPVLVDGAKMPGRDHLPPSILALARRNAVELSPNHFEDDVRALIPAIERTRRTARRLEREKRRPKQFSTLIGARRLRRVRPTGKVPVTRRSAALLVCTLGTALTLWADKAYADHFFSSSLHVWQSLVSSAPLLLALVLLFTDRWLLDRWAAIVVGVLFGQALNAIPTIIILTARGYIDPRLLLGADLYFLIYATGTLSLLVGTALLVQWLQLGQSPVLARTWRTLLALVVVVADGVYIAATLRPDPPFWLAMLPIAAVTAAAIAIDLGRDQSTLGVSALGSLLLSQLLYSGTSAADGVGSLTQIALTVLSSAILLVALVVAHGDKIIRIRRLADA